MRIIVSDSSCLIDLRKAQLLEPFLTLPYERFIPDVLLTDELLRFTEKQLVRIKRDMKVVSLGSDAVERVGAVLRDNPALSTYDGFAFVVAENHPGAILLTGDRKLRELAETEDLEVHGVLWVVQQLREHGKATAEVLLRGLETWRDDPTSRLPAASLGRLISEFKRGGTRT